MHNEKLTTAQIQHIVFRGVEAVQAVVDRSPSQSLLRDELDRSLDHADAALIDLLKMAREQRQAQMLSGLSLVPFPQQAKKREDSIAFKTFRVSILQAYQDTEDAMAPIETLLMDLSQNWTFFFSAVSWRDMCRIYLPAIRQATNTCLDLFCEERCRTHVLTSIEYLDECMSLLYLDTRIDAASRAYTAFIESSNTKSLRKRLGEKQILKQMLQEVCQATHEALDYGRARFSLFSYPE